jgi:nitric oxide dioxygenase
LETEACHHPAFPQTEGTPMTPQQIDLVQSSFQSVLPIRALAAKLFYERLFVLDPSLRPMFKTDLSIQGEKLMLTLATAVNHLRRPDQVVPMVESLGRRHAAYGVKDSHYKTVGEALLWTLEQGLGADFTPDVKDAWISCFTLVSTVMMGAAAAVQPA